MDKVDIYEPVSFDEVHNDMLENDKEYNDAHIRNAPKYALMEAMVEARNDTGMTLEQIAENMGSTKSSLSRMLTGAQIPNWNTVTRFAYAIGKEPRIEFVDLQ